MGFQASQQLQSVVNSEHPHQINVYAVVNQYQRVLQAWGGNLIQSIKPSGSFAKGTAVKCSADIDLFISLHPSTTTPLHDIYNGLANHMYSQGYKIRKQNVSIRVTDINFYSVDLVPGKQQSFTTTDHSIYVSKQNTWTKTNIDKHISTIRSSGRSEIIKLLKIWRDRHSLEFPSLYLELVVIEALNGKWLPDLEEQFHAVLNWLTVNLEKTSFYDPANGSNRISDDLYVSEKKIITQKAQWSLQQQYWSQVVW